MKHIDRQSHVSALLRMHIRVCCAVAWMSNGGAGCVEWPVESDNFTDVYICIYI